MKLRNETIIQAVLDVMGTKGLRFTMADVAEYAGVSRKTLYQHFPNREEMVVTAIEQVLGRLIIETRALVESEGAFEDKLDRFFLIVKRPRGDETVAQRISTALAEQPQFRKQLDRFHAERVVLLEELLRQGMESGAFRPMPVEVLAPMLLRSFMDYQTGAYWRAKEIPFSRWSGIFLELIRHGLLQEERR